MMATQSSELGPQLDAGSRGSTLYDCGSFIPGLPNDFAIQCLLQIPRKDHRHMRKVCKLWYTFIESQWYYDMRRLCGFTEEWIYVLARDAHERLRWRALDPATRQWHAVAKMPSDVARSYGLSCEACHGSLYVIGGVGWSKPPRQDVHRYDPVSDKWSKAAPMAVARCYAVSGILNDRVVVAGGMGTSSSGLLTSVEVYDPKEDRWSMIGDLLSEGDLQEAVVWDKKLHVCHVRCVHAVPGPHVQTYDPGSGEWAYREDEMAAGWQGPATALGGRLYMVDQKSNAVKLMVYDTEARCWKALGRLSSSLLAPPCTLVGSSGKLYVVGRGSTVVEVLVKETETRQGILVTRKIGGVGCASDVVLGCYVLAV